jgi:ribosomal protein S18 acetylase RimI-like enzyme
MSAVHFRPALPDDADAVVPLMHESSRALIDACFRFGDDKDGAAPFLRADFLRGDGLFGYRHQLVGVTGDGQLVATMTAYAGRDVNRLSRKTLRTAWRSFGAVRFLRVVWRSLALAPLFVTPRRDALFMANTCVAASHRSQGVFAQLLAHVSESAHARDPSLRCSQLDVSFGNSRAQALYARLGFVVTSERPYRGRRGLDGFRRMQRPLPPP